MAEDNTNTVYANDTAAIIGEAEVNLHLSDSALLSPAEPHSNGAASETFSMYQDTPPIGYEDIKESPAPPHALANVIGAFADDPQWDEFVAEMAKSRREQDQAYAEAE